MPDSPTGADLLYPAGILIAFAPRDHSVGMRRLREPLPDDVRGVLERMLTAGDGNFCSMRWHAETGRGFWIAVDERAVIVLTIPDLTQAQAKTIWGRIEERDAQFDIDAIVAVVTEVTGQGWQPVTWN